MLAEVPVSRLQLALNVSDLDGALGFYSKLFGTEPAKRRPGYANFVVDDPPLKLVLVEDRRLGFTGWRAHSTISASRSQRPTRSPRPPIAWTTVVWPPRFDEHTTCCSPSRTRSGSRTPMVFLGRSTPCWPTPRP